jgi:protein ImuB
MTGSISLPPARRILALHFPCLSTDRFHRLKKGKSWRSGAAGQNFPSPARKSGAISAPADDPPLVVVGRIKNALRLVAVDEHAAHLGLTRGLALADARAMIPALLAVDEDPAADLALLESIADWAERYTPLVALHEGGLFLDITGCAHLFGGEAGLLSALAASLAAQGFLFRQSIADTPGAAWAVARFGESSIVQVETASQALSPLPMAALRIDPEIVAAMERVGLKRIGQIITAPRAPLAARFGPTLIAHLDRALGIDEEPITPRRPPPVFIAERNFSEPIAREEDISATLTSLASALAARLEQHGEGARQLEYALFRVDGLVIRIAVGASRPIRTPKLMLSLFREKFAAFGDQIDAGFGFDMARLSVTASAAIDPAQTDLTGDATSAFDVDSLLDRIEARLGEGVAEKIVSRESHIPERATFLARRENAAIAVDYTTSPRPLRLFARPEPIVVTAEVPDGPPVIFRWRRADYRVVHAEGPERIAGEWWREDDLTRDYFRVEDEAGHRFWLYRDGLYGSEIETPRWYLHGVFG